MDNLQQKLNFSLEILPKDLQNFAQTYQNFKHLLSQNEFKVFITHINGTNYSDILETATKLKMAGFEPVVHFAVRNLKSEESVGAIFSQLKKAGINQLLLLAGDNSQTTQFQSASEFLETFNFADYGLKHIYLPTFADGHPYLANYDQSLAILKAKTDSIKAKGIELSYISQICFDSQSLTNHFLKLKQMDYQAKTIAGFVAPIDIAKLSRLAISIGIGNIVSFLKKGNLFKIFGQYDSDLLINDLLEKQSINAVHCFAFGNYLGAFQKLIHYKKKFDFLYNNSFYNKQEVSNNGSIVT